MSCAKRGKTLPTRFRRDGPGSLIGTLDGVRGGIAAAFSGLQIIYLPRGMLLEQQHLLPPTYNIPLHTDSTCNTRQSACVRCCIPTDVPSLDFIHSKPITSRRTAKLASAGGKVEARLIGSPRLQARPAWEEMDDHSLFEKRNSSI